jgi:hypothetical protein
MANQAVSREYASYSPPVLSASEPVHARFKYIVWAAAGVLGFFQVWAGRHTISADGVSYLDMGDAFLRGDWGMALNAYWSPLYPVLLGVAAWLVNPSPYWEYTLVNLVTLAIYGGTLLCFHFFLTQLMRFHGTHADRTHHARFPAWSWMVVGYSLFLWSALTLIGLQTTTPDLCVAASAYLAAGVLLRIRGGWRTPGAFAVLGLTVGCGYLAKVAMFPLAFVFLAVGGLAAGGLRQTTRSALVAGLVFVAVVAPWVLALSNAKDRFTISDSGRLNYGWSIDEGGDQPDVGGSTLERTRRILQTPAVYEFATPVGGTYPVWYEPSYWQSGVPVQVDLREQLQLLLRNARTYYRLFFDLHGSLITGLIVLFWVGRRGWMTALDLWHSWILLVPAVAGLAMYAGVFAVSRYVAPFVVLLYLGVFAALRLPRTDLSNRVFDGVAVAILALMFVSAGPSIARDSTLTARDFVNDRDDHLYWEIAESLKKMGLQQGDQVACLRVTTRAGVTPLSHAKWARLARARIIAAIESDGTEAAGFKAQAIAAVAAAGAKVIITDNHQSWAGVGSWQQLGTTNHFAYFLRP